MNLQSPITEGGRVYKSYAGRLEKLGIKTFEDFLFHLPNRYEDYSIRSKIAQVQPGEVVTVQGQVLEIKNQYLRGTKIKTMQKATITDGTGSMQLIWFNQPFLAKTITQNSTISASGKVEEFAKSYTIKSSEYEIFYDETTNPVHTGRLIPIYPETKGVSSKWLRRQIHNIIQTFGDNFTEYLPEEIVRKNNFLPISTALKEVHFPNSLDTAEKGRARLAFDELFLLQLAALKRRSAWKNQQKGQAFKIHEFQTKIDKFIASLPFHLTLAQRKAVEAILSDFSTNKPMNRLLQGDVGSGKTVVATIAMYAAYLNNFQSVLIAPTEILAQQHYSTVTNLLSAFGVSVDLVTGSKKSREYQPRLDRGKVASSKNKKVEKKILNTKYLIHNTDILVGTHAVLNEKLSFKNLGFVVIDEQQRFGVEQRGLIRKKGKNPHLLTMTATPIPRTVALTMYGDLDLSYLNEMPHGRKIVKTWLVPPAKRESAYNWIREKIKETNSQVFIICPFIEESESMQTVKAATREFERLQNEVFVDDLPAGRQGLKLGLLHGKLKAKEKEEVLNKFREGEFDILVATPVVEVGIDISNATIIMIEASERFGLAQLHQLRGRVGRGDKQSFCLLFSENTNDQTTQRLKAMETLYSGAELAELDLKLRGPGNLYGTAQHGIPKLKAASFSDTILIQRAKYVADEVFPKLSAFPLLEQKVNTLTLQHVSPD